MSVTNGPSSALELLRCVPNFRSLTHGELQRVAGQLRSRSCVAGEVLVEEGTVGIESFLIVEGEALVVTGDTPIARVAAGEFVGELALLTGATRCATVRAETSMQLLVLDRAAFEALIDPVTEALLGTLARRQQPATASGLRGGAQVAVRSRFGGGWVEGFEVVDVDLSGPTPRVQVLRHSDGAVLPVVFDESEIRLL